MVTVGAELMLPIESDVSSVVGVAVGVVFLFGKMVDLSKGCKSTKSSSSSSSSVFFSLEESTKCRLRFVFLSFTSSVFTTFSSSVFNTPFSLLFSTSELVCEEEVGGGGGGGDGVYDPLLIA